MLGKFIEEKLYLDDGSLSPEGEAFFKKHLVKEPQKGMVGLDLREYEPLNEKEAAALAQFITKQNKNDLNLGYVGVQINNASGIKAVTRAVVSDTWVPCIYLDLGKSPMNVNLYSLALSKEVPDFLRSTCLQNKRLAVLWDYKDEMEDLKRRVTGSRSGFTNTAHFQTLYGDKSRDPNDNGLVGFYAQMAKESDDNVTEWDEVPQGSVWNTSYLIDYVNERAKEKAAQEKRREEKVKAFKQNKKGLLAIGVGLAIVVAAAVFDIFSDKPKDTGPTLGDMEKAIGDERVKTQERLEKYDSIMAANNPSANLPVAAPDSTPTVTTQNNATTNVNRGNQQEKPVPAHIQRQQWAKEKAQIKADKAKKEAEKQEKDRKDIQKATKDVKPIEIKKSNGLVQAKIEITGQTVTLKSLTPANAMKKVERPQPAKPPKHKY